MSDVVGMVVVSIFQLSKLNSMNVDASTEERSNQLCEKVTLFNVLNGIREHLREYVLVCFGS